MCIRDSTSACATCLRHGEWPAIVKESARQDSELIRCAHVAAQEFGGFVVAEDLHFHGIPLDFAAGEHGDLAEPAGGGGMQGDLGRSDGAGACADGIDELFVVAVGAAVVLEANLAVTDFLIEQ